MISCFFKGEIYERKLKDIDFWNYVPREVNFIYIYTYIYIYICIYIYYEYLHIFPAVYVKFSNIHSHTHNLYIYIYIHIHIYLIYTYIYIYIHTYICISNDIFQGYVFRCILYTTENADNYGHHVSVWCLVFGFVIMSLWPSHSNLKFVMKFSISTHQGMLLQQDWGWG
jgi:hypothetical protein